jgi:CheY-like chemotaxis protein
MLSGVLTTLGKFEGSSQTEFAAIGIDTLSPVAIEPTVLRQALLNLLVYARETLGPTVSERARLMISGADSERGVTLRVGAEIGSGKRRGIDGSTSSPKYGELLEAGTKLLASSGGVVETAGLEGTDPTLTIVLPPVPLHQILVVDDNVDVVGLFRRFLRDEPYRLIQATSGTRAFEIVQITRVSAIILDVLLPSQDGWDILHQLKTQDKTRDVPVVICSVLEEGGLARSLGASDFLIKPVTRPALLATLRQVCADGGPRRGPTGPSAPSPIQLAPPPG